MHLTALSHLLRLLLLCPLAIGPYLAAAQVVPPKGPCGNGYCTYELSSVGEQISCELHRRLVHMLGRNKLDINSAVWVSPIGGAGEILKVDVVSNDLVKGLLRSAFAPDLGFSKTPVICPRAKAGRDTGYQLIVEIHQRSAAVWLQVRFVDRQGGIDRVFLDDPFPIAVPEPYTRSKRS